MMQTRDNRIGSVATEVVADRSVRDADRNHAGEAILAYQLDVLKAELDYRTAPAARRHWPITAFVKLHLRQLAWTIQRFLRLDRQSIALRAISADWPARHPRGGDTLIRAEAPSGRILVDVSSTYTSNMRTGIQRVVMQFVEASKELAIGRPVLIRDGSLFYADVSEAKLQPVAINEGDVLFLLDSTWQRPEATRMAIKCVQREGCHVVAGLHDLIPIEFRSTCSTQTVRDFTAWLDMALHTCDAFLCVSETTARALVRNAENFLHGEVVPPIGWFSLGASFTKREIASHGRVTRSQRPYVLMVGTIEPRKGHPIGLEAMETLWLRGIEIDLVIIGRCGWNMRYFEERLRTHPEVGRRLTWMSDASDDDLIQAYERAAALIFPSIAEGFGLPIIEAASFKTRAIVSDLEIFREIAPPGTIFFEPCCPKDLATAVCRCLDEPSTRTPEWTPPTWRESAEQAAGIMLMRTYQIGASRSSFARIGTSYGDAGRTRSTSATNVGLREGDAESNGALAD